MREAKFRYVYQHEDTGCIMMKYFTLREIETDATRQFPRWYPIARNQYTSVFDKNGKEIYEDDIVREDNIVRTEREIAQVIWQPFHQFHARNGSVFFEFSPDSEGIDESIEIIGNIYEHHELLKGE